jgi:BCD family chlorophyll transporter-like MFS transporter
VLCAAATVYLTAAPVPALALAVFAYALVGMGVGAAGTSLLVLMAKQAGDRRRAAAATIMWVLMIAGFAITSTLVGHFLDPYSPRRLIVVVSIASVLAFVIAAAAVWRVERVESEAGRAPDRQTDRQPNRPIAPLGGSGFRSALRRVWSEPEARGFTLFVFISMLAYSAQELLLEPFAGIVFRYSVGGSAQLSGLQHSAVFLGMIGVGIACSGNRRFGSLRGWTIGGCFASAFALLSLAGAAWVGPAWPLRLSVFALGVSNGVFAVAAIGSMMELAHKGETGSAGVRMGLWGAAQALAFALGGLLGTGIVDSIRYVFGSSVAAFGIVFCVEAALFLAAGRFASRVDSNRNLVSAANSMAVTI